MEQVKQARSVAHLPWKWGIFLAVGLLLLGWVLNVPAGLLGKADAVGYAVCHRIDRRSFHIGTRSLPLCARCSGQYLGAALGLAYQFAIGRRRTGWPGRLALALFASFLVAYGVDGVNSYLHLSPLMNALPDLPRLYEPNNTLRLFTGTGVGLGVAALLYPAFNSAVWKQSDPRPALGGLRALGGLLALAVGLDLLVLTGSAWVLYPLALVSAGTVLVLLTIVYAMIWVMLFRQENRFDHLGELALPLVAGFGGGLAQIALLDLGRYLLTKTWNGFYLG
jgi:uncharacterized membrane protein